MSITRQRLSATGIVTAVFVAGAVWASPAQAAMQCESVPGRTVPADVKVGPVTQHVPEISNVVVCAGGLTGDAISVTTSGGECVTGCLNVTVGGEDVDLEGGSVSWAEDGVTKTRDLDPPAVPGGPPTCVISVGIPKAPDPQCTVAFGVGDPTGIVEPVVAEAARIVGEAVGAAIGITCDTIPDWYSAQESRYVDFCDERDAWVAAVVDSGTALTCSAFPIVYDEWGQPYRFCDDPLGWTLVITNTNVDAICSWFSPVYDYESWRYVYFCEDPVRWTEITLEQLCGNLCDPETLLRLIEQIRIILDREIKIQVG